jgi:hypothetical protein
MRSVVGHGHKFASNNTPITHTNSNSIRPRRSCAQRPSYLRIQLLITFSARRVSFKSLFPLKRHSHFPGVRLTMIKLAAPSNQSRRHSIRQSIGRTTRRAEPVCKKRPAWSLRASVAIDQGHRRRTKSFFSMALDHHVISDSFATRHVVKSRRSDHVYGPSSDCAMQTRLSL